MTETVLIALIGVIGTLVGAIGATLLANLHARKQRDATRMYEVQDSARALIVAVLIAARDWRVGAMSASMSVAAADSRSDVDQYLRHQFTDSSTGQQLRDQSAAFNRATTELMLLLSSRDIRASISELQTLQSAWWEQVIDASLKLHTEGKDKVDRLKPWIRFDAEFEHAIVSLETVATLAVATARI